MSKKAPNRNFSTKSVPDQCGFSNSAVSWRPKNHTNRGPPVSPKNATIHQWHYHSKHSGLNSIFCCLKINQVLTFQCIFLNNFKDFLEASSLSKICKIVLEYTLKCSHLISSSDNKKILLTTRNVRLVSGHYATNTKALSKHEWPNFCQDARFLNPFFCNRQLIQILKDDPRNGHTYQQSFGTSCFDRALEY